jgi:DNA-binding response OmpR family regulator
VATILVVDDDASVRELVTLVLEYEGHEVRVAEDGHAALRSIEEERPDCVILDLMMPRLNGHEVLEQVRAADGGPDLPIIMLTAMADDEQAWRAWTGGVDYFLTKPFDSDQLLRFLNYLFTPSISA